MFITDCRKKLSEYNNMVLKWAERQWIERSDAEPSIALSEVKFKNQSKTIRSESCNPTHLCPSGTKVKGSKMIRYRRSLNYKLY